jgi:hypothetical protein
MNQQVGTIGRMLTYLERSLGGLVAEVCLGSTAHQIIPARRMK